METEIIDKLFLELSQVTSASTEKELRIVKNFTVQKAKTDKLKSLLLLTDKCVSDCKMNAIAIIQWQKFIKCFPDEA